MEKTTQNIITWNRLNNSSIKYCRDTKPSESAHPIYYGALYEACTKVIEITNNETSNEARLENLNTYLKNKAKSLKAKYRATKIGDYFDAAYVLEHKFIDTFGSPIR